MERPFMPKRLGVIMEANCEDPQEYWGVLNPGCMRGPDGELYLFPRLVAANDYSRIGLVRVQFDSQDNPCGVERLGIVLEPTQLYEQNQFTAGCEDPRLVYIDYLERYIMSYTAYGPLGPRIALAASQDLFYWKRLGPVVFTYEPEWEMDFNLYPNKDAALFPEPVIDPLGRPALALLHSPTYDVHANLSRGNQAPYLIMPKGIEETRSGIWISYCPLDLLFDHKADNLVMFSQHQLVMTPCGDWQRLKVGAGTPPIKTTYGWVTIFHGASGHFVHNQPSLVYYSAGALVLDLEDPRKVLYRSAEPILEAEQANEREGTILKVVYPTGIDLRENDRVDLYYGMADERIGVTTMQLPGYLPQEGHLATVPCQE